MALRALRASHGSKAVEIGQVPDDLSPTLAVEVLHDPDHLAQRGHRQRASNDGMRASSFFSKYRLRAWRVLQTWQCRVPFLCRFTL